MLDIQISIGSAIAIGVSVLAAAGNIGYLLWSKYYLTHNIPELWKEIHALKDLYHTLDKQKLTRELHSGKTKE